MHSDYEPPPALALVLRPFAFYSGFIYPDRMPICGIFCNCTKRIPLTPIAWVQPVRSDAENFGRDRRPRGLGEADDFGREFDERQTALPHQVSIVRLLTFKRRATCDLVSYSGGAGNSVCSRDMVVSSFLSSTVPHGWWKKDVSHTPNASARDAKGSRAET